MVGKRKLTAGGCIGTTKKKTEILVNVQMDANDQIALVPVNKEEEYGSASGEDRDGDDGDDDDMSDNPMSDPELLETEDGRLILDIKRNKSCGKCKKMFKTSAEMKAHKPKCPGVVDEIQDVIQKERKAAKYANPGEEFHKYCNPNPEHPCYCCGEDTTTAHVGHIRCKFCPKSFKAYNYMERHISSIHSESDAFPCGFCNAKCSSQDVLDQHVKTHSDGKPFSCLSCGKEFTRRYHLDRHEKHTNCGSVPKEVLACEVCGKEFTRIDNLREHLRSHMGQGVRKRDYQCPYCAKSFYGSSLLNIHIRTHTGEKPFPCDLCPLSFPSTGALRKHRRKHTGERPYRCDECSATFAARETLNRHRKTHTGEKPHECTECGKRFIQATQLRSHMFNHTGKNGYECKECKVVFSRQSRLNEHIKFEHKGHQPFECDKCSKLFIRKEDLVRHVQIHSDSKSFECAVCGKFFATKTAVTLHQRTHSDGGPVKCKVCSGHFKRPDCLMRHMRSKHREHLEKLMEDAERENVEKHIAKRDAKKEATVEIDGAVYQITTMDEGVLKEPETANLEPELGQSVEVFEVMELPEEVSDGVVFATGSAPGDLLPIVEEVDECKFILPDVPKSAQETTEKPLSPIISSGSKRAKPKGTEELTKNSSKSPPLDNVPKRSVAVVQEGTPNDEVKKIVAKQPNATLSAKQESATQKPSHSTATVKSKETRSKSSRVTKDPPGEEKQERKRVQRTSIAKRLRANDDDYPIFLSDAVLEQKISELLQMLMGEDMLRSFGWPSEQVEKVLERVIVGCGHQPAKGEEAGDHTTRMRENTKILFSVTMDDEDIKALLNNHTVDEVIMHVLKNK